MIVHEGYTFSRGIALTSINSEGSLVDVSKRRRLTTGPRHEPMMASQRPAEWHGVAVIGLGWAAFDGHAGDNHPHAHHALQLAVADTGDVAVAVGGAEQTSAPGVLINSNVVHRLEPGRVRLFYIEASGNLGRTLATQCGGGIRMLSDTERREVLLRWREASLSGPLPLLEALGISEGTMASTLEREDRVDRIIASLARRLEDATSLTALAADAALSPSRFRHLVSERVGMPLRPYVRWLRLQRALESAARGANLTEAAQSAGFADAAHLTRTMRRHFGVPPSAVVALLRPD